MWGCGLKYPRNPQGQAALKSPPMWGCGLKYMKHMLMPTASTVTPYVGVWIEIKEKSKKKNNFWSPPMWGCGLKFDIVDSIFGTIESPPMWGCGLKYYALRKL